MYLFSLFYVFSEWIRSTFLFLSSIFYFSGLTNISEIPSLFNLFQFSSSMYLLLRPFPVVFLPWRCAPSVPISAWCFFWNKNDNHYVQLSVNLGTIKNLILRKFGSIWYCYIVSCSVVSSYIRKAFNFTVHVEVIHTFLTTVLEL
jgi:hypothetical protein